jgi:hypothetical protein
MLHKITKFINPFMAVRIFGHNLRRVVRHCRTNSCCLVKALATAQICIMIAYGVLTYHDVSPLT